MASAISWSSIRKNSRRSASCRRSTSPECWPTCDRPSRRTADNGALLTPHPRRLVELTRDECLELLAATGFGRIVVGTPLGQTPIIRPVTYVFDEPSQAVAFRTAEGSKFHALVSSTGACFEIDGFDPSTQCGWSVIIAGTTEHVTRPSDVRRLEARGLPTVPSGPSPHWVRIRAWTVTGRRVTDADAA